MKSVTVVRGTAIPLDRTNVDTDQIIPARHLKRIERTGYGPYCFEAWRADPDFVLNKGHEFGKDLSDGDKRALIDYQWGSLVNQSGDE